MTHAFNEFADVWSRWIFAMSWQLVLLILIIGLLVALLRNVSPRLRHGLWLLVLIKVFLPPTLWAPTGIGHWGLTGFHDFDPTYQYVFGDAIDSSHEAQAHQQPGHPAVSQLSGLSNSARWCFVWIAGAVCFWSVVVVRYVRLARSLQGSPNVEEGPVRIALERSGIALGIRQTPQLKIIESLTSPFLIGVVQPCIVLPRQFVSQATDADLASVLTHELIHFKRFDTWVGWLQVIAQGLFWFHPFFWWASRELRHEREEACDEAVLQLGKITPERYGETMMRVLTSAKASSVSEGSLVGVFEKGTNIQTRLEKIMNFRPNRQRLAMPSTLVLFLAAIFLLPMGPKSGAELNAQDMPAKTRDTPYPQIVKLTPEIGATGVSTDLKQISVTFDRDMEEGMSWTGGGKLFPKIPKGQRPRWTDKRTCVLPVELAKGKFYRLGFNSLSNQNFRGSDGTPLPPAALYFVTEGAKPNIVAFAKPPEIVKMIPANNATDVDAKKVKLLRVKFSVPMGPDFSWVGGGPNFPKVPNGKRAYWSKDRKTCMLPVELEANTQYRLGLNSTTFNNFQSEVGIPLEPIVYEFQTK